MAQGEGSRWKPDVRWSHVDIPAEVKQLIPLGNETILTRTLRQVSRHVPQKNVHVVMNLQYALNLPPDTVMLPLDEPTGFLLRGIWIANNRSGEADRTVVLLGDVVYSNNAIQTIFEDVWGTPLFGRQESNYITGKKASELFALAFSLERSDYIIGIILSILKDRGRKTARLWDIFDWIDQNSGETSFAHDISDYTDDVDSIQEYVLFFDKLEKAVLEDDERLLKN